MFWRSVSPNYMLLYHSKLVIFAFSLHGLLMMYGYFYALIKCLMIDEASWQCLQMCV